MRINIIGSVNFVHVSFQSAPINLLTSKIFPDLDSLGGQETA